ncbi:MAG: CBS domain-containing protein [Balneolaceae bacterium]|nr:MAG: CBS domain-containing protein [Balneolaceae bacterium]
MIVTRLINTDFTPLYPDSPVSSALAKMDAWQSSSIPVIDPATMKLKGHVLFEDLASEPDESLPVSDVLIRKPVFSYTNQHIFEVVRQMLRHEVRILAVVDHNQMYLGVAEKKSVLEALSEMLNISTRGSVITVQMNRADYKLSELAHLIESENAKILGLTVAQASENEVDLLISIKLNCEDTSAITSSLRRYGYLVSTENKTDLMQLDLSSRADELMRYLDL